LCPWFRGLSADGMGPKTLAMDEQGKRLAADMLARAAIEPTPLRLLVAYILAHEGRALPAVDILDRLRQQHRANKVTLYRILDLFVDRGLAQRHSSGDRALRYCLGPRFSHQPHCHAYCVRCGRMECLPAAEGLVDLSALGLSLAMEVEGVEVRIDGICEACRRGA
jgi:Fur family transcriptional regulator, ferric uptake regulator